MNSTLNKHQYTSFCSYYRRTNLVSNLALLLAMRQVELQKYVELSNLDITNKLVGTFLFTISNVICIVNPQNGSWVLFTISRNSLYRDSLYQGLSSTYLGVRSLPCCISEPIVNHIEFTKEKSLTNTS